jgi:hypothetical protein
MEAAILQYAEAEAKKRRDPTRQPTPGLTGWLKDRAFACAFVLVLLAITGLMHAFD